MPTATAQPDTKRKPAKTLISEGGGICGFCNTGNCDLCPGKIRDADPSTVDSVWTCAHGCCTAPKCLDCKMQSKDDVDLTTWVCIDEHACAARREAKRNANEALQRMNRSYEMVTATQNAKKATKATAKPAKAPAAPKVGKCLHTGKATKGGKFAPGQDAAYVSAKVKAVMSKSTTEAAVKKEMAGHGLSEALIAKFVKGLAIAAEKERTRAATEAEAKAAKAAAKK